MFEKILYTSDFSGVSKTALDYVKGLKEAGTKQVVVLHVIDLGEFASTALDARSAEISKSSEKPWKKIPSERQNK